MTKNNENQENIVTTNCRIKKDSQVMDIYSVYLTDSIVGQENYIDLIHMLRQSECEDSFVLYLNNRGGLVSSGIDIIHAIQNSKATIYTVMCGPVSSMAPLILLQGQKIKVEKFSYMMFHDYSGGTCGKGNEMEAAVNNTKPFFNNLFKAVTKGFLTVKEQKNILDGRDLYLNEKEVKRRLKKMGKLANE